MVIREVGVGSAAKIFGALYTVFGLLAGVLMALLALGGAGLGGGSDEGMPGWFGALFGVGAVIILPIIYGIFGAIFAALAALFYNVVAGMVGGLQIETE